MLLVVYVVIWLNGSQLQQPSVVNCFRKQTRLWWEPLPHDPRNLFLRTVLCNVGIRFLKFALFWLSYNIFLYKQIIVLHFRILIPGLSVCLRDGPFSLAVELFACGGASHLRWSFSLRRSFPLSSPSITIRICLQNLELLRKHTWIPKKIMNLKTYLLRKHKKI